MTGQHVLFIDEWMDKVHQWHKEHRVSIVCDNSSSDPDNPSDNHDYRRMFEVQSDGSLKVRAYLCWKSGHFIAIDYKGFGGYSGGSCGNCDTEGIPWWGKVIAPDGIAGQYILSPDWQEHVYEPFRQSNVVNLLADRVTQEEKQLAEKELSAFSH